MRTPTLQTLQQQQQFAFFKTLLPPRFQKAIKFIYQKNHVLYLVLNHQGYLMEINYNLDLIKQILKKLQEQHGMLLEATSVKCFVSHSAAPKPESASEPHYHEHATGEFEVLTDNPALKERFEMIKRLVCRNS